MAVVFHEAFAGGFFGLWRTYGAVARIESDSPKSLPEDWRSALEEVRLWRERRGRKSVAIHFHFVTPPALVADVCEFVSEVLVRPADLPKALAGLTVDAVIFDPDGGVPFETTIRPG